MQRKCSRCGEKYTLIKDEKYCPDCMKVMTPPGGGVSREITCESCGQTFTHTKEKLVGRWPKYCPTCAEQLSKPYKKDSTKTEERQYEDINAEETIQVPTAEHMDAMYGNVEHDAVNHPSHYTRGKIEVIDFIEDQQLPYHLGNVIKYVARAGYKGNKLEDLKKARWYLDRYINEVMGNETV